MFNVKSFHPFHRRGLHKLPRFHFIQFQPQQGDVNLKGNYSYLKCFQKANYLYISRTYETQLLFLILWNVEMISVSHIVKNKFLPNGHTDMSGVKQNNVPCRIMTMVNFRRIEVLIRMSCKYRIFTCAYLSIHFFIQDISLYSGTLYTIALRKNIVPILISKYNITTNV